MFSGPREGFCTRFNSAIHGRWSSFSTCCSSFGSTLKANFVPAFISLAGRLPSAGLALFTMRKTMDYMMKKSESDGMDPYNKAMCFLSLFTSVWVSCISKGPATFNKFKGNVKTTTEEEDVLLNKTCNDFKSFKSKTTYLIVNGAAYFSWGFMNINSYLGVYKLMMFLHGLAQHLDHPDEESSDVTKIIFKITSVLLVIFGSAYISWIYNVKRSHITAAELATWLDNEIKTLDRTWIFSMLLSIGNLVGQFVLANFTTYHALLKIPLMDQIPSIGLKTIAGVSSISAVITAGTRDTNYINRMLKSCCPNNNADPETPTENKSETADWDQEPSCVWQTLAAATYVIGAVGSVCMGLTIVCSFDFSLNDWGTTLYDPPVIATGAVCASFAAVADFAFQVLAGFQSECLPHAKKSSYAPIKDGPAAEYSATKTPREQHGLYQKPLTNGTNGTNGRRLDIRESELSPVRDRQSRESTIG